MGVCTAAVSLHTTHFSVLIMWSIQGDVKRYQLHRALLPCPSAASTAVAETQGTEHGVLPPLCTGAHPSGLVTWPHLRSRPGWAKLNACIKSQEAFRRVSHRVVRLALGWFIPSDGGLWTQHLYVLGKHSSATQHPEPLGDDAFQEQMASWTST